MKVCFVTSAYNEESNLEELYSRCMKVFENNLKTIDFNQYSFIIANNRSTDNTKAIIERLSEKDKNIIAILNKINYGPEASTLNALKYALDSDYIIMMCSDLQDPPEIAGEMMYQLTTGCDEIDSVLGIKKKSSGNKAVRLGRKAYYKFLGYSSRLKRVPAGFHGFGCYQRETIKEVIEYWETTDLNLRQCLINACQNPQMLEYKQAPRAYGTSSYKGLAYLEEAAKSLLIGDAIASRLAIFLGLLALITSFIIGLLLAMNYLAGNSGYTEGVPTVLFLIILFFAVQMLMFGLLSRQIESLKSGGFKPKVKCDILQSLNSK